MDNLFALGVSAYGVLLIVYVLIGVGVAGAYGDKSRPSAVIRIFAWPVALGIVIGDRAKRVL